MVQGYEQEDVHIDVLACFSAQPPLSCGRQQLGGIVPCITLPGSSLIKVHISSVRFNRAHRVVPAYVLYTVGDAVSLLLLPHQYMWCAMLVIRLHPGIWIRQACHEYGFISLDAGTIGLAACVGTKGNVRIGET